MFAVCTALCSLDKAAILGVRDSMEKVVQAVQSEIKERQEARLVVIVFVT